MGKIIFLSHYIAGENSQDVFKKNKTHPLKANFNKKEESDPWLIALTFSAGFVGRFSFL